MTVSLQQITCMVAVNPNHVCFSKMHKSLWWKEQELHCTAGFAEFNEWIDDSVWNLWNKALVWLCGYLTSLLLTRASQLHASHGLMTGRLPWMNRGPQWHKMQTNFASWIWTKNGPRQSSTESSKIEAETSPGAKKSVQGKLETIMGWHET